MREQCISRMGWKCMQRSKVWDNLHECVENKRAFEESILFISVLRKMADSMVGSESILKSFGAYSIFWERKASLGKP